MLFFPTKPCYFQRWSPRKKRVMGTWSHDRLGLEEAVPNFKGAGKHDVLPRSPDLAKLNLKCHMDYS